MWNSLCTIWRTLNNMISILTVLIVLYLLYSILDGRFHFSFWRPTPVFIGNAKKQPEPVNPWDENLVDDNVLPKRAP